MSVLTINETFAKEVDMGLASTPKVLPTRFIYDDRGTQLFEQIMEQPEYYLTNCETEILKNNPDVFSELVNDDSFNLVELGAGDGTKTKLLLSSFTEQNFDFTYFPIDISQKALDNLKRNLNGELKHFNSKELVMEYFQGLNWLKEKTNKRNLVLFLGSNIGNLDVLELQKFMSNLYKNLNKGDIVVIGFDLVKNYRVIEQAYNDKNGVTKAFTLNLLTRINRELEADFDLEEFDHHNFYNPAIQANEAYIVSKKKQSVFIGALGKTITFKAWEPIRAEYSFKYSEEQICDLANYHGFEILANLFDSRKYFCDSVWQKN